MCALSMPLFYPRFQAFSAMRMCGDETLKSGKAGMEEDERVWLEQSKGVREKDRKFSSGLEPMTSCFLGKHTQVQDTCM